MSDEKLQDFTPWQTWGDVPENVKAQLLSVPRKDGLTLESGDLFSGVIKKLAPLLLLLLFAFLPARAQTTTVTGNVKNLGTGAVSSGSFVRFYLRGCAGNQPRVNGTAIIAPTLGNVYYFDFPVNSSGAISGTLYSTRDVTGTGNGAIECGGSLTAVWYGMVAFLNGKAGPETPIHAKATATLDISSVTPITSNPVTVPPADTALFAEINGGNQLFTGGIQSPSVTAGTLNGDPLTTAPLNAVLGIGDLSAVNVVANSCCNANLIVGMALPGGTYKAGNVPLWSGVTATGTFNVAPVVDGFAAEANFIGTINPNGNFGGSLTAVEAQAQSNATGNPIVTLWQGVSGEGAIFSGNMNATYWEGLHGTTATNAGTGKITGAFGTVSEQQNIGTVNYSSWDLGDHLVCNGCGYYSLLAVTNTTSAAMSGCPGACLVTVTDTAHGYSTSDFIWYSSGNPAYRGFYQITVTGANTFTYVPLTQASNAAHDGAAQVFKIGPNLMAVDGSNRLIFNSPLTTASNGAMQWQAAGSLFMDFSSPFLKFDPAGTGYQIEVASTSGIKMDGGSGSTVIGTTGGRGNMVTDNAPTIISPKIKTGISTAAPATGNTGFQHLRVSGCATGAAQFNTCDTTVTWTAAFADANYTATCTGDVVTSGVPIIEGENISAAKQAASITVRTIALTAAAAQFTTIDCQAVHD